jgi:AraC family transcriptional activator of pobA
MAQFLAMTHRRRQIPLIDMLVYGQDQLRREGIVMKQFADSTTQNPGVLEPHYHDFFQISLLWGPASVMHDFREFDVRDNTLLFLSPGQVHTMIPGPKMDGIIVSFTREFFGASSGFLMELPFFFSADRSPALSLPADLAATARDLFCKMQREYVAKLSGWQEILRALLRILFVHAERWQEPLENVSPKRSDLLVREFHQQIERHFLDWQSLGPYAHELGVTPNHLNDVVKEVSGRTAGEHIRARRLLDAKRLLLYSQLTVSEIGYHLGFKDPSYFSRFFRRYEEVTPRDFRERIREKYRENPG